MRTTINYLFVALLGIVMLASCKDSTNGPSGNDLTLVPSSETFNGDGVDAVTFTVTSGGNDVTADAKVFLASDNSELKEKSFSTDKPGTYEFYATYNDIASANVTVKALGGITLTCDVTSIAADGKETATFTVMQEGTDVTAESTLYEVDAEGNETKIEGMTYTTTVAGNHTFIARKGTAASEPLTLLATAVDNNPDRYDGFKERAMLLQFTAQGCGYCPLMKAGIKELKNEGWDEGVTIACHVAFMSDTMYPTFWQKLWNSYSAGAQGIPTMSFNLDKKTSAGAYQQAAATASNLKQTTKQVINEYPVTSGIAATYTQLNEEETQVIASVKIADDGDYRVAAWLLEDHINAYQSNYVSGILPADELKDHCDVLRAMSNTEPTGEDIEKGANKTHNFTWTFKASDLKKGVLENTHVVVFVTKKEGSNYIVNNIIECGFNDSVSFEYVD